jgi:hypothetical protein|tara:strand:- start:45 stop:545 length:501 start_codon:yes stop_codon:yes gene_type:complete
MLGSLEGSPPSLHFHHHQQLAMTAIDFQTLHAALDKDPKYQELMDRVRSYNVERSSFKQKQREALRKIIQFNSLEDVAMDRMGDCEGDSDDGTLRDSTGMDQETWFWHWSGCQDVCFDGMVQAAIDVSNAQSMLDVVRDKQNVNSALMDARRDEVKAKLEKEASES